MHSAGSIQPCDSDELIIFTTVAPLAVRPQLKSSFPWLVPFKDLVLVKHLDLRPERSVRVLKPQWWSEGGSLVLPIHG